MDTADLHYWFFLASIGVGGLLFLVAIAYGAQTVRDSMSLHGMALAMVLAIAGCSPTT